MPFLLTITGTQNAIFYKTLQNKLVRNKKRFNVINIVLITLVRKIKTGFDI